MRLVTLFYFYSMKCRNRYTIFDAIFLLASFSRIVFVTRAATFTEPLMASGNSLVYNIRAEKQVIPLFPTSLQYLKPFMQQKQIMLYEACIYKIFIKLRC
ncbi:hypothetical protein D3C87_953740 [compost metagenome]